MPHFTSQKMILTSNCTLTELLNTMRGTQHFIHLVTSKKKKKPTPPKKNQEHPPVLTILKSYLICPLEIFIKYTPNDEKFYTSCNNL